MAIERGPSVTDVKLEVMITADIPPCLEWLEGSEGDAGDGGEMVEIGDGDKGATVEERREAEDGRAGEAKGDCAVNLGEVENRPSGCR